MMCFVGIINYKCSVYRCVLAQLIEARFVNGYCSRVRGRVRGWVMYHLEEFLHGIASTQKQVCDCV